MTRSTSSTTVWAVLRHATSTNWPLGDVLGHFINREVTCYALLEAASLLGDVVDAEINGRDPKLAFKPIGDPPQDRQGTDEYRAADLSPCNIVIAQATAIRPSTQFAMAFNGGIARSFVKWIMAETDLVHFIVNVADSRIEGFNRKDGKGLAHILTDHCTMVARDPKATPKQVFFDLMMPAVKELTDAHREKADEQLFNKHSDVLEDIPVLLDHRGDSLDPPDQPTDFTIHSKNCDDAWRANRLALRKVLEIFHAAPPPPLDRINAVSNSFQGLRYNEMRHKQWMAKK